MPHSAARVDHDRRHAGTDAMRYVLCLAVVVLHSLPRPEFGRPETWAFLTATICRGAVPFFFVASGFYAPVQKHPSAQIVFRPLRRLLPAYAIWLVIYLVADRLKTGHLHFSLATLATGGSGYHLWFLPALGVALALVCGGTALVGSRATGLICLALALAGLMLDGYRNVFGLPELGGTRILMAPLPVYIGALIRRSHLNITIPFAILAVLGCWIAIIAEEELIGFVAKRYPESHNAVIATFGLGVSLFLLSQALPRSDAIEKLARLGRISLGVYALHLLIIINLAPILGQQDVLRVLTIAAVTFTVATLVSVALARQRLTRPLVA